MRIDLKQLRIERYFFKKSSDWEGGCGCSRCHLELSVGGAFIKKYIQEKKIHAIKKKKKKNQVIISLAICISYTTNGN